MRPQDEAYVKQCNTWLELQSNMIARSHREIQDRKDMIAIDQRILALKQEEMELQVKLLHSVQDDLASFIQDCKSREQSMEQTS